MADLLNSVPANVLALSPDHRIRAVTGGFLDVMRLERAAILHQEFSAFPVLCRVIGGAVRSLEDLGGQSNQLFQMVDAQLGTESRVLAVSIVRIENDLRGIRYLISVEDLTKAERMKRAGQASEQRFLDLMEDLQAIFWEADPKTLDFGYVSRWEETVLGHPIGAWGNLKDVLTAYTHPEDLATALQTVSRAMANFADCQHSFRMRNDRGAYVQIFQRLRFVRDCSGEITTIRGLMFDVDPGSEQQRLAS